MRAMLIWDGGDVVNVPPSMGEPCDDQLTGTTGEKVIELACRLCYDSMGLDSEGKRKGRATPQTLAVILKHRHHSVLEHVVRTVEIKVPNSPQRMVMMLQTFLNRRGIWTRLYEGALRVTLNGRAVVEWDDWSERLRTEHGSTREGALVNLMSMIGTKLQALFALELPHLVQMPLANPGNTHWAARLSMRTVEPESDHEKHITLYLCGSRGFSHEQVRHRFGISQRSTRFADEHESPWDLHPLIEAYIAATKNDADVEDTAPEERLGDFIEHSRNTYGWLVNTLQDWLLKDLVPDGKPSKDQQRMCRKQARGAARGMLGNALRTDMAFTASVADWRHVMIPQRGADAADAEIRRIFMGTEDNADDCVLGALTKSRYADRFTDIQRVPSADGTSLRRVVPT